MTEQTNDPVVAEILGEVSYQESRWGTTTDDTLNTPWMFTAYIAQYASRWMAGSFLPLKLDVTDAFRKSMVKVAAIAISAIRSVDRQRAENGRTFYEA